MPWTSEQARQHKKDLTDAEAKTWAKIANAERSRCLSKKEGDESHCDGQAIRVAGAAINNARKKATASEVTTNAPHGEGGMLTTSMGGDDEGCVCPKCGHKVKSEEGTPCSERTCPQCGAKMSGAEAKNLGELTVYKAGNKWRWLTVSNVAVEDREREIVSEKAYDDAIAYAYKNNDFGELDLVHVDGTDAGPGDLMLRLGKRLIEGGEWFDDNRSTRNRVKVQANPDYWGVSIKFKYDPEQFDGKVYKGGIRILKRTILPRRMAASYGTAIAVHGGAQVKKIDEETIAALKELDMTDEEIAALVEKQKALPTEEFVKIKEEEVVAVVVGLPWYEDEGMEDTKSVWETSSVNDLPDSCFLFIEDGGSKDKEGKTEPRSLRHLPYKSADGSVDLPHLRNALSRLGQAATGKDWKGFNRAAVMKKAQGILASHGGGDGKDDGKSIDAMSETIEVKTPVGFFDTIKAEVQKVLDSFKKVPELERPTADVGENSDAELEVESEKEVAQEPVAPIEEKHFVTQELLQAYGTQLAQTIAAVVAEKVAELALEQEKAKDWRTATEKRLVELAKPVEQRVMDRLAELPPIVKTRVSHLDATAKNETSVATSKETTYLGKLMESIEAEVKRGQKGDGKVVV